MKTSKNQQSYYDSYYSSGNYPDNRRLKEYFVRQFISNFAGKKKILELGGGSGTLTGFLLAGGARVLSVDIAQSGVNRLKRTYASEIESGQLAVRKDDILDWIERDPEHYDAVVGAGILHHIQSSRWKDLFVAVFGLLNENGVFACGPEPNAGGIYQLAWRLAPFFYNRIYRIPYDPEIEADTFQMKPKVIRARLRETGFQQISIKPYQAIPHFSFSCLAAADKQLIRIVPAGSSIYLSIVAKKTYSRSELSASGKRQ